MDDLKGIRTIYHIEPLLWSNFPPELRKIFIPLFITLITLISSLNHHHHPQSIYLRLLRLSTQNLGTRIFKKLTLIHPLCRLPISSVLNTIRRHSFSVSIYLSGFLAIEFCSTAGILRKVMWLKKVKKQHH